MKEANHLALPFYPSFEVDDEPLSGFGLDVPLPRFAHGYWSINNRLEMLVESHSWKDYAKRVKTHHDTVLASLQIAQLEAKNWRKIENETDSVNLYGQIDLEYKHSDKFRMIDFPGYKFSIEKSSVYGEKVINYDQTTPQNWTLPFYEELKPTITVLAPEKGYLIQPSDADWILPKLKIHGIKFTKFAKVNLSQIQVFRANKTQFTNTSFEGHQNLKVDGVWKTESIALPIGMILVPIKQAKSKLVVHLFEPLSQDSFLGWGFFNKAFEEKEYMENYVAEDVAKEMLKNDEIKRDFYDKLKIDPEFASSASKRFEFFYKKHPSWDDRFNRYPVFKL